MSTKDHEEIFLQPECCADPAIGRTWCKDAEPEACSDGKPWTRYVRGDLFNEACTVAEDLARGAARVLSAAEKQRARLAEVERERRQADERGDEAMRRAHEAERERDALRNARPLDEWHEDKGPALWWKFPVEEPPYCGTPNDDGWPFYHTHWTPIPIPFDAAMGRGHSPQGG